MPASTLLVISDLHLTDGCTVLEEFHPPQQAALELLLRAALPGGSLGLTAPAELVLNGDTFDFLNTTPFFLDGFTTPTMGLAKLGRIAAAHQSFFAILRWFLSQNGRLTFLIGNHDFELAFPAVQAELTRLLDPAAEAGSRLYICREQQYRPRPDIWIEHGHRFDGWNCAYALWGEQGRPLADDPSELRVPPGTLYVHNVALPMYLRYPCFERFDPPLGIARQLALLSLLDPALVADLARSIAPFISADYQPLRDLSPEQALAPAELFPCAVVDMLAFQHEMRQREPAWEATADALWTPAEQAERQAADLALFLRLNVALSEGTESALTAIFAETGSQGGSDTTKGLHGLLQAHSEVRIALAGHTHLERRDVFPARGQLYLNTATWTRRFHLPTSDQLTPAVLAWLRDPDLDRSPLTSATACVYARVTLPEGEDAQGELCVWT